MAAADNDLSPGEVETIVENATVDTSVQYIPNLDEIRIDDADTGERIATAASQPDETIREQIRRAVELWEEQVDVGEELREELQEQRQALQDQFGVDLPPVPEPSGEPTREPADTGPAPAEGEPLGVTGLTTVDVADIIATGAPGLTADVEVSDQLVEVATEVKADADAEVDFGGFPPRIQGETEEIVDIINEIFREWTEGVDFNTINIETVNERRESLEAEHNIELIAVRDPQQAAPDEVDLGDGLSVDVTPAGQVEETIRQAAEDDPETGEEFIARMREQGNRVLSNPFDTPIVEIIAPEDMRRQVRMIIDKWDINPAGHDVTAQSPSFADQRPEVADDLVAWQFFLEDEYELGSSGFDLANIISELEDEPVLFSTSTTVGPSIL